MQFRHAVLLVRKGFKDTVRIKSERSIYIRGGVRKEARCMLREKHSDDFQKSHGVATGGRSCGTEEKKVTRLIAAAN